MSAILIGIAPAFGITQFVVSRYRAGRDALAVEWSKRGEADLPSHPAVAVSDFSTALSYGPDRAADRFLLSKALVAAGRSAEAEAQLQALASEDPANSEVNLELARIAAANGAVDSAVRYYHAAIDGVWTSNAVVARRNARIALARLLMAHGQAVRAQAELIALIDELPEDSALLTDIGGLLSDAGATARALGLARRALAVDPSNANASKLAGALEFQTGDMAGAARDLASAARAGALETNTQTMLEVSGRVLALDPYAGRLNVRARAQRAQRVLGIARARFDRCTDTWIADPQVAPSLAGLGMGLAAAERRSAAALERDPDSIDETVGVALDVEKIGAGGCRGDTTDDRALALIAARPSSTSQ
jgi:tetratricopeptide (TPR) repeat protein